MVGSDVLLRDQCDGAASAVFCAHFPRTVLDDVGAALWRLAVSGSYRLRPWLVAAGVRERELVLEWAGRRHGDHD
ncbi:MAG TPA: hypothetical protein VKB96_18805, partial [Gammaproteobacteria bacterium]|nr:hypothetical protein [Gammaproteobacteria bacterium]